ncbi:solute carrier family 15 member 2-like [Limulus polyphemus]|uniref:Solute carrier family 15 member 2-like n=1 Tax=Limulus polyphemus TaxID=6850 RepID=A0ABM1TBT7_LIMPO|nr:solute carrier family 15 member 2-like [Limulus polyphemus]
MDILKSSGNTGGLTEETNLIDSNVETQKERYPKSVIFIVGNEFCERFCYYGMKAVLTLYLTMVLLYDEDTATMIYHTFSMGCYFTPLFGAMLADSFLGKFKSSSDCLHACLIHLSNAKDIFRAMSMIGLTLIAIGTGGIKPCVAAFGGDQFGPGQGFESYKL